MNGKVRAPIISLCFMMCAMPFILFPAFIVAVVLLVVLVMALYLYNKGGYSLVLLAALFVTPHVQSGGYAETIDMHVVNQFRLTITILIVLIYGLDLMFKKHMINLLGRYGAIVILFICLTGFWALYNKDDVQIVYRQMVPALVFTFVFFNVCLNDPLINKKGAGRSIVLIAGFAIFFYFLEALFKISPYPELLNYRLEEAARHMFRPSGLFSISLIYSVFIVYFEAWFLINARLNKWQNALLFTVVTISVLISVTRTTFLGFAIVFLLCMLYGVRSKMKRMSKVKHYLLSLALVLIGGALVMEFFPFMINMVSQRFQEGDIGHRLGAYKVVSDLVSDYPFGVGASNVFHTIRIENYQSVFFLRDFEALDNFFLTNIAAYGVFSLVCFVYYFIPFHYALKHVDRAKTRNIVIYLLAFVMLSFSFDIHLYPHLQCFLMVLLAYSVYKYQPKDTGEMLEQVDYVGTNQWRNNGYENRDYHS